MLLVPILISVAFFTLMERKFMGLTHFRLGPNKVGISGVMQPFSDAIKLLTKENIKLNKANSIVFTNAPVAFMIIAMAMWLMYPTVSNTAKVNLTFMYMITILSVSIFFFITSGWASVSKYSILGSYRATAQTISYEIAMIIIILPSLLMYMSMNLSSKNLMSMTTYFMMMTPLLMVWLVTMLAETNRTPFDMAESESELVSGYNTEYSNGQFSMLFIAEYSMFIIMSFFTVMLFINTNLIISNFLLVMSMFIFFIWTRVSFPRMRYDFLMNMAWKMLMPASIAMLMILTVML